MDITILQWRYGKQASKRQSYANESGRVGRWRIFTFNALAFALEKTIRENGRWKSRSGDKHAYWLLTNVQPQGDDYGPCRPKRTAIAFPVHEALRRLQRNLAAMQDDESATIRVRRAVESEIIVCGDHYVSLDPFWRPADMFSDAELADDVGNDVDAVQWLHNAIHWLDYRVIVEYDRHAEANRFTVLANGEMVLDRVSKSDARRWGVETYQQRSQRDAREISRHNAAVSRHQRLMAERKRIGQAD